MRKARFTLLTLGVLATLVAFGYTIENVRGKRALEACKRNLEAKGKTLDWTTFIPAAVPDEQNVFAAPDMTAWFVRSGGFGERPQGWRFTPQNPKNVYNEGFSGPIAEVTFVKPGWNFDKNTADAVLKFGDPASARTSASLVQKALSPALMGIRNEILVAHAPGNIKPVRLVVEADAIPGLNEMSSFLLGSRLNDTHNFLVAPGGSNSFRVVLKGPVYQAADFLTSTDQLKGEFSMMRKALERPLLRMEGAYDPPISRPYINFVGMRSAAQALGTRAQCHLLLGQSDEALQELTLIHDLCRLLTAKPNTLVAAMIDSAVTGLYIGVVQEGMALHAWNASQLATIQAQLAQINLVEGVSASIDAEVASSSRTFEISKPDELARILSDKHLEKGFWAKIQDGTFWFFTLSPRGWINQNVAIGAELTYRVFAGVNPTNRVVQPAMINEAQAALVGLNKHFSPYTILVTRLTPNYVKACMVLSRNQALVHEAIVACALERYRLKHDDYPASLDELVPEFLSALPHDVIKGGPLKYQRIGNQQFLLYSIGWNSRDDRGVEGETPDQGDWVWAPVAI